MDETNNTPSAEGGASLSSGALLARMTAELSALRREANEARAALAERELASNLGSALGAMSFVNQSARQDAEALFRQAFRFEAGPGGHVAIDRTGARMTIADAARQFAAERPHLVSATVAPGAPLPYGSMPSYTHGPRRVHDLSEAEFDEVLRQGVRGKLTSEFNAPTFTIRTPPPPPAGLLARRNELLARARGADYTGGPRQSAR